MRKKNKGFSDTQRALYWGLIPDAWKAYAKRTKADQMDADAMDEWRRDINKRETGFDSTTKMNRVDHFDCVMMALAIEAGHERWMAKLARAAEDRMLYILRRFLDDLGQLMGASVGWSYVRGIAKNMKLPGRLEDCPAELLARALIALDVHIQRTAKRQGVALESLASYKLKRPGKPAQDADKPKPKQAAFNF